MNDHYTDSIRVPPQNVEAEQAVLGALMIAPEAIEKITLSHTDFYRRDHQLIFRAVQELHEHGKPYDAVTLGEWFESQGLSEHVAGGSYLIELSSTTPSAANVSAYADIVAKLARKRELIDAGTQLVNNAFNGLDPDETIVNALIGINDVSSRLSSERQKPLDLFGDYELPALLPEHLPPGIARFAYDQAEIIGTAPELVAFACIGAAAAALHDNIVLRPKWNEVGYYVRACLWTMLIAPPGMKKSAALKAGAGPITAIDKAMQTGYGKKNAEYEEAEKVAAMKQKARIRALAKGEPIGYDEPEELPQKPPMLAAVVMDATTEALSELARDNPRGLLWKVDELVNYFSSFDQYAKNGGGKDRGIALTAYDGGPYTFHRIGRGRVQVDNLSYSVLGTTQPEKIAHMMSKSPDDGLVQRFMVMQVARKAYAANETKQMDMEAYTSYNDTIHKIWNYQPGGEFSVVGLSPEADAIRTDFYEWAGRAANNKSFPEMLCGHFAKWEGLWCRLVLTYHAYGCASQGGHPALTKVTKQTATRVTRMMKEYLMPQALRFYRETLKSDEHTYAITKKVAGMIMANGSTRITNRELLRGTNIWRGMKEWQKQSVIGLLKESGWLLGVDNKRSDATEAGWTVNPQVHVLFAERAAREREARRETAANLKELRDAAGGRL